MIHVASREVLVSIELGTFDIHRSFLKSTYRQGRLQSPRVMVESWEVRVLALQMFHHDNANAKNYDLQH